MNDYITVKKEKPEIWLTIVEAGLVIGLLWLIGRYAKAYAIIQALHIGSPRTTYRYSVIMFGLVFGLSFLFSEVELKVKMYIWYLKANEEMVAIRKSALDNSLAVSRYEEYKKYFKRYTLLKSIVSSVFAAISVVIANLLGGRSPLTDYLIIFVLLSILSIPLWKWVTSRSGRYLDDILLKECDPRTAFDILELRRQLVTDPETMKGQYQLQMISANYLQEWDTVELLYRKMKDLNKTDNDRLCVMFYLALSYLTANNEEKYREVLDEIREMEMSDRLKQPDQDYAYDIRAHLDMIEKLRKGKYDETLPILKMRMEKMKDKLGRMELLYYMGQVQLALGDKEQAEWNLRQVKEQAGTMAVQKQAVELLSVIS